jgi:hypothetical protein
VGPDGTLVVTGFNPAHLMYQAGWFSAAFTKAEAMRALRGARRKGFRVVRLIVDPEMVVE